MFIKLLNKVNESAIDFPRGETLNTSVWDFKPADISRAKLKDVVKNKIFSTLDKFPEIGMQASIVDLAAVDEDGNKMIHITGSIGTNQYKDDADIDVHIVIPEDSKYYNDKKFAKMVHDWFDDNRDKIDGYFENFPIEVYIQSNIYQEYLADACYNIISEQWLKGPKIVPEDYDPYEDYSGLFGQLRNELKGIDLQMGELKRDIIDYETIKQAIAKMSRETKKSFLDELRGKLEEIENGIKLLYNKRLELVKTRSLQSQPQSKEQAANPETKNKWREKNAEFKFIARYQYLRIIKELEQLLDDETEELSPKDVKKAKRIVGGIE